ncbi:MAG: serine/threonine-protein kinase [Gemmatimonadales bacterium]
MPVTAACFRCNAPLADGVKFCPSCGLSVSGEHTAPLPTLLQVLRQATLGEYEIVQEVGQGGMATVYMAHEIALDRKVAIKVMSPQFVHGDEMIARFKREARTAAGLTHPHIIPIYAVKESQQLVYFVMKYIRGRSLDQILRDVGPLPFPMVRSILADIGSALDYAHRQGVVHRDVKPGNIMIDEEGFAVITDFGIARAIEGEALTRSGTTVGTPSYLSPEACSGETVGAPADQYALGVVGYEMITGQLPFSADSSLGMMYAQVHTPPRSSEQFRPDCPPDLRDAVMRMLAKTPGDRFPTLREAAQAASGIRISGGHSLGDDSVRSHIGLLAAARASRPTGEVKRTPTSPVPLPRVLPGPIPRKKRVHISHVLMGLFLAGLGAGLAYVGIQARNDNLALRDSVDPPAQTPVQPEQQAPAPTAEEVRADSTLLVARGAAAFARQRAVAVGGEAAAIAAGDSLMVRADSLAASGRKAEASSLVYQAANQWTATERAKAPETAAQRPVSRRDSTGPGRTETYAPAPLPDSAQIVNYYADLERAVESKQLGEVKRLLPNLSEGDERSWKSLFEDSDVDRILATFRVVNYTRGDGPKAYARIFSEIRTSKGTSPFELKRKGYELATLTLGPQGWRQIASEKTKP